VTLALKVIASAQAEGDAAAYFDLSESLDADYAARCGVDLEKLLLIRPQPEEKSLEMLHDLVEKHGAGVIAFDAVSRPSRSLHRLTRALRRTTRALAGSMCAALSDLVAGRVTGARGDRAPLSAT
jgi:RecA/RadA recombinase